MTMKFSTVKVCLVLMLAIIVTVVVQGWAAAAERNIIAVFGDGSERLDGPQSVWRHLWNANGEIGRSAGYAPMTYVKETKSFGVMGEDGKLTSPRDGTIGVIAGSVKDAFPRYAVYAYTFADDSRDYVWLNNGNLHNRLGTGESVVLKVYLNDELKYSTAIKRARLPHIFRCDLGRPKKGDTVYVAVGPEKLDGSYNLFSLRFILELSPAGKEPPLPINTVSPPITESAPKRSPDGEAEDWYSNVHKAHCGKALKEKPEMVLLGDSITAYWPVKVMGEKLGAYKPANMGIAGDWIQNVLWRVENGVLDQVRPKVIVLLIGTNNLGNGFTPDEVVEGTGLLVKKLQEKSPQSRILLMGILPRSPSPKDTVRESIRQVNAKTALFADNRRVFFLDIGSTLTEPDGTLTKEIMPDGLHPGVPGYMRWADAMLPVLETLFKD